MKRVFALLLAVLMVAGLLAGCSGDQEENVSTAPSSEGDPSVAPSYDASQQGDAEDEKYEISLPLVDDGYTFTYWAPNSASFEDFATFDDNLFFQWMEEQTGVHIEFSHPPVSGTKEAFQTMVLSQDFPDFVQDVKGYYDGGMDKAISDGFLLRLNEYVDEYMPYYRKEVYRDEETFVQCISDSGNLWAIHRISDVAQGASTGLGIRADWLERAGLTTADCETIDQLGDVLRVFKDYTYQNCGPLYLPIGALGLAGGLNGGYNVSSPVFNTSGFLNKDGVATYSPLEPGMKAFIGQIADWYAEGLVNKDYIGDNSYLTPQDRWGNSEVGVGEFCYVYEGMFATAAANSAVMPDPDFELAAITTPKVNASDDWATDVHVRAQEQVVQSANSCGITTQCSNIELACKWWDYQWTDEGKHAANWGPYEGEKGDTNATYYVDETDANGDGHVEVYQPWLLEKYGSAYYVQVKVARHVAPNYNIWSREWSTLTPREIEFCSIWEIAGSDWWWPTAVTLTAEEGDEAAAILTACTTYFQEWSASVITGEKSIDTYDTELVPTLESMGIETAIADYQAALDRYLERSKFLEE